MFDLMYFYLIISIIKTLFIQADLCIFVIANYKNSISYLVNSLYLKEIDQKIINNIWETLWYNSSKIICSNNSWGRVKKVIQETYTVAMNVLIHNTK